MDGPKVEETPVEVMKAMAELRHPMDRMEDEIICVLCLEFFNEPVVICCGHNFCESCILRYWASSGPESDPSCPQCECAIEDKAYQHNLPLASVTRITKELNVLLEKKGNWIVCMSHLEPMKLFCKEDEALICVVCKESQSHGAHKVLPIEEAAEEYKDQIKTYLEGIKRKREIIFRLLSSGQEEGENMLNQTKKEIQGALAAFKDLRSYLNKEESLLVTRLEQVNEDILKKKSEYTAELTGAASIREAFINEMEEKFKESAEGFLHDIKNVLESCMEMEQQKFENPNGFLPDLKQQIFGITCQIPIMKNYIDHFKETLSAAQKVYKAKNMTLDPDTANHVLHVTKDRKCVEWATKSKMRPDNSLRFESEPCVLGSYGFSSGIWHWMVEIVKDEGGWAIGIAKESVNRKGVIRVNPEAGIWGVVFTGSFSPPIHLRLKGKKLSKIQVWLDVDKQQLGITDHDTSVPIYSDPQINFSGEKLYPFFKVGNGTVLRFWP